MFELKFLGTTSSSKEELVHVHFKIVHVGKEEGTELSLRINTSIPSNDVSHILKTKTPTNWYNDLIKEIESQFSELARLGLS